MIKFELVPDLSHCVETVARKKHAELSQRVLGGGPVDADTGDALEILRLFLETADFATLRAESEKHLIAGKNVRFTVYLEEGEARWEMHVT